MLWIYLPYFFADCKLMQGRKFISKEKQVKAAHLLQYAVDESENSPENELTLNKILCGLDIHQPIERFVELSDSEKQATHKLIRSAVKNWPILKNTSVEGYQQTFLQREGKIIRVDDGWQVIVERKTLDVLLKRLPYSIGMIRQPWMRTTIWVEWV